MSGESPHCSFYWRPFYLTMPISQYDLQRVISVIADEEELKATVKGSVKGGLIAGVSSTVGGLLAGPVGLLIGGVVGGTIAYGTSEQFKPVSQVIKDLTPHQRKLLYDYMKDIIDKIDADDVMTFMAFVSGNGGMIVRKILITRTIDFIADQLNMKTA